MAAARDLDRVDRRKSTPSPLAFLYYVRESSLRFPSWWRAAIPKAQSFYVIVPERPRDRVVPYFARLDRCGSPRTSQDGRRGKDFVSLRAVRHAARCGRVAHGSAPQATAATDQSGAPDPQSRASRTGRPLSFPFQKYPPCPLRQVGERTWMIRLAIMGLVFVA